MKKRRDRHEIISEILAIAIAGEIKTHIMYKAKLSYSQINEYLPLLVARGFLEKNTKSQKKSPRATIYRTTPKGLEFMKNLEIIDILWEKNKTGSQSLRLENF